MPALVVLVEENKVGKRWNHQVKCIRSICRIREWLDDLHLLDDRARPSVADDERQRIFMFRTNVNEMNVEPIDLGDEVRQGFQSLFALTPVEAPRGKPVASLCKAKSQYEH